MYLWQTGNPFFCKQNKYSYPEVFRTLFITLVYLPEYMNELELWGQQRIWGQMSVDINQKHKWTESAGYFEYNQIPEL